MRFLSSLVIKVNTATTNFFTRIICLNRLEKGQFCAFSAAEPLTLLVLGDYVPLLLILGVRDSFI